VAQISKALGGRVVAVCRGAKKAESLRGLGADAVIDTSQQQDTPLRVLIKVTDILLIAWKHYK
jgi:NADPH:quinone reductase-like Zn-dependent oxidoreductase